MSMDFLNFKTVFIVACVLLLILYFTVETYKPGALNRPTNIIFATKSPQEQQQQPPQAVTPRPPAWAMSQGKKYGLWRNLGVTPTPQP
jgi:hypothetical protein